MIDIEGIREINGRREITIDNQFIADILSGKAVHPHQYPLQAVYNRLSHMEATIAGMERGKPVMHVGTGWPGTAIGLYTQFGTPVTCVEKNPEFAQQSYEGLRRLDLIGDDKLQVVCADGAELNPEGFRVVIISAMVPNKDRTRIIRNLRELASDSSSDPLLVLRTPTKTGFLLYQELDPAIINNPWLTKTSDTASLLGPNDPLRSLAFRVHPMAEFRRGLDRIFIAAQQRLQQPLRLTA